MAPRAVYLLPCIAGHVGADAAAVALSRNRRADRDLTLIVDVGTNAEILLGDTAACSPVPRPPAPPSRARRSAPASAPPPAPSNGIEIDPATKEPRFRVIGCDLWSDDPGFAEATKAPASPASAAPASSRRWPRCAWRA
jgi:hypothetical protein